MKDYTIPAETMELFKTILEYIDRCEEEIIDGMPHDAEYYFIQRVKALECAVIDAVREMVREAQE